MESTRPIRALMRGLDALTVLNMRDGATVSEVAHEIRLPRTTVYRILETLCNAGFVFRDEGDDRYRLTLKVRALSGGFDDEAWVKQIAKPLIHELCRDIVWPIALSTPSGGAMIGRETTDHASPLATDRLSAGLRAPMLGSAAGLATSPSVRRRNARRSSIFWRARPRTRMPLRGLRRHSCKPDCPRSSHRVTRPHRAPAVRPRR